MYGLEKVARSDSLGDSGLEIYDVFVLTVGITL
jgi:hypothetical protein